MRVVSAIALGLALLCASVHAEPLEISGSSTVKDVVDPMVPQIRQSTGVDVKMVAMGTGRGMLALYEGKAAVAAISESLDEAITSSRKMMSELGLQKAVPANLVYHEFARDRVVVFVHKDNPVAALTKAQLKDLFSGKVRNWKEVGGPDAPVQIFLSSPGSATRAIFQKMALDGGPITSDAAEYRTSVPALLEASRHRGGLAIASPNLLDDVKSGTLKIIQGPAVERPLALVTLGNPSEPAQKVIEYLHKKK